MGRCWASGPGCVSRSEHTNTNTPGLHRSTISWSIHLYSHSLKDRSADRDHHVHLYVRMGEQACWTVKAMPAKWSTAPAWWCATGARSRRNGPSSSTTSRPSNDKHLLRLSLPLTFYQNHPSYTYPTSHTTQAPGTFHSSSSTSSSSSSSVKRRLRA